MSVIKAVTNSAANGLQAMRLEIAPQELSERVGYETEELPQLLRNRELGRRAAVEGETGGNLHQDGNASSSVMRTCARAVSDMVSAQE